MIDIPTFNTRPGIAGLIVGCTARKTKLAPESLRASTLAAGTQAEVAARWLSALARACTIEEGSVAERLYDGRGFRRASRLASQLGVDLAVVSAGLGLVPSSRWIPAYDLTLARSSPDSILRRVAGRFNAAQWWDAIRESPFSSEMGQIAERPGRILVAVTQPYARLVGSWFERVPATIRIRLRLLGEGLEGVLPTSMHPQVVRYDRRLDAIARGTRLDAPIRAAEHFAQIVQGIPVQDADQDQRLVEASLAEITAPAVVARVRLQDDALRDLIRVIRRHRSSAREALADLRIRHGVACESSRFQRLFMEARP